jgi:multiple sugar transport system permease protein
MQPEVKKQSVRTASLAGSFNITKVFFTALMAVISLFTLSPLVWMLSASAKVERDVLKFPIEWMPKQWHLVENFKTVWAGEVSFSLFYFNSIKLSVLLTLFTLLFSSMAAYSFAKLRFPFRNGYFVLLISFMIIPEQATLVPRYILIKWLGLYNTHEALILMGMFSIYFTFLLRQFMLGINNEYLEAAKMDGAGYFRSYWQIILPLSKPILATVAIIKFIWSWNDYQNPLIFLYTDNLYTIPLGIQKFRDEFVSNYSVTMSASVSAIVPLIILFIILQKQVIQGISLGGVKG